MGASASTDKPLFNAKSTAEEIARHFGDSRVRGRSFLITGAGAGLGFESARVLALQGGRVTMAARSQQAAEDAVARVRAALGAAGAGADLHPLACDLGSIASVEAAAASFLASNAKLDVLINNAGVMAAPLSLTKDGLEQQFGVNHVGHQHFTTLIMPALAAAGTAEEPARVVNLSSMGNWLFALPEGVAFDRLAPDAKSFNPWTRYSETKLCNILHAHEVSRRAKAAGQHVVGIAVHPGAILGTKLARHMGLYITYVMFRELLRRGRTTYALTKGNKTIPEGAATQVLAALDPAIRSGYYADCKVETYAVHPLAFDDVLAAKLWDYTEKLVADLKAKK